tara:strand:+ start:142 stop:486 length:345 start_codon:yes stop_codon:yes gene_type:complete
MAQNATVAYQGWSSSNIAWGESTWGNAEEAVPGSTASVGSISLETNNTIDVTSNASTLSTSSVTIAAKAGVSVTGNEAEVFTANVLLWSMVDTNQTPSWTSISTSQTPDWKEVA